MKIYKDAGYFLEIVFVYASEETMILRANKREKETGRHTSTKQVRIFLDCILLVVTDLIFLCQIRNSMISSAKNVVALGTNENVHRVKMVDNSSDDEDEIIVYDSDKDPNWAKGGRPPVEKFIPMNEGKQNGKSSI